MGIFMGTLFFDQDYHAQSYVININGLLYSVVNMLTFYTSNAVLHLFSMELPLFLQEQRNGMYRTGVYYFTKQVADVPVFLLIPTVYITLVYWMVGLNAEDPVRYLNGVIIAILVVQAAISFGDNYVHNFLYYLPR